MSSSWGPVAGSGPGASSSVLGGSDVSEKKKTEELVGPPCTLSGMAPALQITVSTVHSECPLTVSAWPF